MHWDERQSEPIVFVDDARFSKFPASDLSLSGWCADADRKPLSNLSARVDGRLVECLVGLPRPDLVRHFSSPVLQLGGFAIQVPARHSQMRIEFFSSLDGTMTRVGEWRGVPDAPNPPRNRYEEWLAREEEGLFWPPSEVAERLAACLNQPLISIILPVYNTNSHHLYRCFQSVLNQKYPHWQICVCDDASGDVRTLEALANYSSLDPRITVTRTESNGGISAASNLALSTARGEFVVLLDHDDELHPYTLAEMVRRLQHRPEADILFADEDKIDQSGNRSQPAFKPCFDSDLLLAFNYIGHPLMLRRSLVERAGGFRKEYDGAQDWDLLLRCSELTTIDKIEHIAKPLYHWRLHEDSTSMSLDAKPYAQSAWKRVLADCLQRRGLTARVMGGLFLGSMRLKREIPPNTKLGVITRTADGAQQTKVLQRARRAEIAEFLEIDSTLLYRAGEPSAPLKEWDELECDVLLFVQCALDNINHFFLEELVSQSMRGDCGMVSGLLVDERGTLLSGPMEMRPDNVSLNPSRGESLSSLGYMGRFKVVRSVACVAPSYFAVRTAVMREWGPLSLLNASFPARFTQSLVALCHKKDLKVLFTPYAIATARQAVPEPIPLDFPEFQVPESFQLNRNLNSFANPSSILQYGI